MDEIQLDCRGLICPQPVIKTREALEQKPATVTVLVDNAPASENVRRLLEKSGYSVSVDQREATLWAVTGRADASCAVCAEAEAVIDLIDAETAAAAKNAAGPRCTVNIARCVPKGSSKILFHWSSNQK